MRQWMYLCAALWTLVASPLWAHGAESGRADELGNAFCPVSIQEPVDPAIHADHRGRQVYFCCAGCRDRFISDPSKYLANLPLLASATEASSHAGHEHGVESAESSHAGHEHGAESAESVESSGSGRARLVRFAGKLHPLAVHFPIALLLTALVTELIGWQIGGTRYRNATDIMLLLGAPAAIIAATLGWSAASGGSHATASGVIDLHRWLGIASALAALLALALRRWRYRILPIAAGAILVGVTGYFGGVLVHGAEHFRW